MRRTKPLTCPHCGKPLNPSHGNQKYHVKCGVEVTEKLKKEYLKGWYERNRKKVLKQRKEAHAKRTR